MSDKSARELAFLRDLYIDNDWTARFTNILDESLTLPKEGKFLYVEPGTGNHLLGLREKLHKDVKLSSVHGDVELLRIAEAKAQVIKAKVDFHRSEDGRLPFPDQEFNAIIADASFISPTELPSFLTELYRVTKKDGFVNFFLPTAGSYGEFFSLLWEALFTAGMEDTGGKIEELILTIPQVEQVEEIAKIAGLAEVNSSTKTEYFEYDDATKLMESFLLTEFLLPRWLDFLTEKQKKKIVPEIIRTIDEDIAEMSFRLSVKATLISGKK
jgi:ubiquinone/menaquinone biosynthesis C-methylase UbiE